MSARRLPALAVLLGVAAAVAVALLPRALGHAWLAALFFWSGVPVASIGYLLIMRLVGGEWRERLGFGFVAGARALPVTAAAMVPVVVAMPVLYPWVAAPPSGFAGDWLQPWAFVLRSIVWFAGLAAMLVAFARRPAASAAVASIGLLFLVPMGSLIAVDWLMSLDPEFHSSGFGLQALSIQFTVALMVAAIRALRVAPDPSGTTGGMMLTLLLFWGYFAYLPFFIVWSGNTPAGAAWYLARAGGGWGIVAALAALLHIVPLLALLFPAVRRSTQWLIACALASLAGDALQSAWMVLPTDGPMSLPSSLIFVVALLVIGAATLLTGERR